MQLTLEIMRASVRNIIKNSTANGDGLRLVIFFQGCNQHCPKCHNKDLWPIDNKYELSLNTIYAMMEEAKSWAKGITLSGGEPFLQEEAAYFIAKKAHELGLDVWTYTGYIYENLRDNTGSKAGLLDMTDVLVDGPYLYALGGPHNIWKGSSNQRIINLKNGRKTGSVMVGNEEIHIPMQPFADQYDQNGFYKGKGEI